MRVCDFCLKVVDDYKPVITSDDPVLEGANYKPKSNMRSSGTLDQASIDAIRKKQGQGYFKEETFGRSATNKKSTVPFRQTTPNDCIFG